MRQGKIHYQPKGGKHPWCGNNLLKIRTSPDPQKVTCFSCRGLMRKAGVLPKQRRRLQDPSELVDIANEG